jgi:hypothetical protein
MSTRPLEDWEHMQISLFLGWLKQQGPEVEAIAVDAGVSLDASTYTEAPEKWRAVRELIRAAREST